MLPGGEDRSGAVACTGTLCPDHLAVWAFGYLRSPLARVATAAGSTLTCAVLFVPEKGQREGPGGSPP
jgi:hypothetical protein